MQSRQSEAFSSEVSSDEATYESFCTELASQSANYSNRVVMKVQNKEVKGQRVEITPQPWPVHKPFLLRHHIHPAFQQLPWKQLPWRPVPVSDAAFQVQGEHGPEAAREWSCRPAGGSRIKWRNINLIELLFPLHLISSLLPRIPTEV